jgi:hypothetical protein
MFPHLGFLRKLKIIQWNPKQTQHYEEENEKNFSQTHMHHTQVQDFIVSKLMK